MAAKKLISRNIGVWRKRGVSVWRRASAWHLGAAGGIIRRRYLSSGKLGEKSCENGDSVSAKAA